MVLLRGKVSWALSEGPGRAIRRNGPAASQTQLFARFPSVLHAASSLRFLVKLYAPLTLTRTAGGKPCSNTNGELLIYGLTRRRPAARAGRRASR